MKPEIFSALGAISLSIGKNFERYFPAVISSLESASEIEIHPDNEENVITNIIRLRKTILQTYAMFVHSHFGQSLVERLPKLHSFLELIWKDKEYRTKSVNTQIMLLLR